jgi:ketosteroid isomerase-like protein
MREEDLEVLRRGYEALSRGDLDSVLEFVDPDIEWTPGEEAPEAGMFTGRDEFVAFVGSWTETFDDFRLEPEEVIVEGDWAVVLVHQSGRGRGSGIELDIHTVHAWRIRDGKAVAWAAYRSRRDALAAIREPR